MTGVNWRKRGWSEPRTVVKTRPQTSLTQKPRHRLTTVVQRRKIPSLQILLLRFKVLFNEFESSLTNKSSLFAFQECSVKNNSPQSASVLQHQSKSFPPRHLQRTSSISSESSIENLQQVKWIEMSLLINYSHCGFFRALQQRGSSPQIRFSGLSANDAHDGRFLVSFLNWLPPRNSNFRSY